MGSPKVGCWLVLVEWLSWLVELVWLSWFGWFGWLGAWDLLRSVGFGCHLSCILLKDAVMVNFFNRRVCVLQTTEVFEGMAVLGFGLIWHVICYAVRFGSYRDPKISAFPIVKDGVWMKE